MQAILCVAASKTTIRTQRTVEDPFKGGFPGLLEQHVHRVLAAAPTPDNQVGVRTWGAIKAEVGQRSSLETNQGCWFPSVTNTSKVKKQPAKRRNGVTMGTGTGAGAWTQPLPVVWKLEFLRRFLRHWGPRSTISEKASHPKTMGGMNSRREC